MDDEKLEDSWAEETGRGKRMRGGQGMYMGKI